MTMKGPINPATRASSAAASSACWTKSRRSRSAVMSNEKRWASRSASRSLMDMSARVTGVVEVFADHHIAAADLYHRDVCAIQLRQRRRGHHLLDGADAEPAVDQIKHPIHVRQNGIDLVGDKQHRGLGLASARIDEGGHHAGVGRVEVEQRLVA